MNISNAICNLLNVVFIAMGNAVGIISGQYLGASKFEKAKRHQINLCGSPQEYACSSLLY